MYSVYFSIENEEFYYIDSEKKGFLERCKNELIENVSTVEAAEKAIKKNSKRLLMLKKS
tara:strand:+ start:75 stop:251 length:177 start_codon:yes stop_codon:yes gene_type:complete